MQIGVTGAYGFLGAGFIARCESENLSPRISGRESGESLEVTAFYANNSSHPLIHPSFVKSVALDIRDYASCLKAFEGLDAIVHFSGKVEFSRRKSMDAWRVNALGTANALRAARESGVSRFVHISSISVLGSCRDGKPALEDNDPFDGRTAAPTVFSSWEDAARAVDRSIAGDSRFVRRFKVPYIDTKIAAEGMARRYAKEGMDLRIAYPGTVIGPGDVHDAIGMLVHRISSGTMPFAPRGATSFVDSRDFSDGVLRVLTKGKAGGRYILSGRDEYNMDYREFYSFVASRSGRTGFRPKVPPYALTYAASAVAEYLAPKLGLSRGLVISGSVDQRFSSAKTMEELGYDPSTELGKSVDDCLEYYRSHHSGSA